MKLSGKLLDWRKPTKLDKNLQVLETELYETLTPIEPRSQFVEALRQNLLWQMSRAELTPSSPKHQSLQTGLLVTGGILGSVVVVLAGIRGIVSLIGIVGLFISWLKQNSRDSLTPSKTSPNLAHS